MEMTRRHFLLHSFSCTAMVVAGVKPASATTLETPLFLSAARDHSGAYYLVALTAEGDVYYQIPVSERAHDSLFNPRRNEAVYFGRSPSESIYVVDIRLKKLLRVIQASSGRHFYGHGVIDNDAFFLYAVENNTHTGRGCVGIYDMSEGYRRVGELDTQGIGPHQILLLSDNKTLVVANGGLKTTSPRIKQSPHIASFESSLVYIDIATGKLLGKYSSLYAGNSLRHLSANEKDEIFIGAQSYAEEITPLVFSHKGEEQINPFDAEDYIWQTHNRYTGSVAVSGKTVAISTPKGNALSFWDSETRQYISHIHRLDIAGLSSRQDGQLFASTGEGLLIDVDIERKAIRKNYLTQGLSLDNHLSAANICCPKY